MCEYINLKDTLTEIFSIMRCEFELGNYQIRISPEIIEDLIVMKPTMAYISGSDIIKPELNNLQTMDISITEFEDCLSAEFPHKKFVVKSLIQTNTDIVWVVTVKQ